MGWSQGGGRLPSPVHGCQPIFVLLLHISTMFQQVCDHRCVVKVASPHQCSHSTVIPLVDVKVRILMQNEYGQYVLIGMIKTC